MTETNEIGKSSSGEEPEVPQEDTASAESRESDAISAVRRLIGDSSPTQPRILEHIISSYPDDDHDSWEDWARRLVEDSEVAEFDRKLRALTAEVEQKAAALVQQELTAEKREERVRDLEKAVAELTEKYHVSYLLGRVGDTGQKLLLESENFRNEFLDGVPQVAFVVSVDIRRSTELMLKAREPHLFASFIRDLADALRTIVLENRGVFDKFTGDGILAVFPEFYSGDDAGYLAVKTAVESHRAFAECYKRHRTTFISVLLNSGLGIGIDFGRVHMLQVGQDFTVVGTPVVYACRMAGATAGRTFVNQPAYERLESIAHQFVFEETEIDIKNEGPTLAYYVREH